MASAVLARHLLARPALVVGTSLVALAALAWWQLLTGGGSAGLHHALHAAPRAWGTDEALVALAMWHLMAVAMMLPTAAPAILAFADISRHGGGSAAARLAAFVLGYLAAWSLFSVGATIAQWALTSATVRMPALQAHAGLAAGALLLLAGGYQFSALKDRCLSECRSPLAFFLAHWRDGTMAAGRLGLRHGLHCVGCCWALMALMLAAGAMNLAWTAALTVLMLAEKTLPAGRLVARAAGVALICGGLAALTRA
ncbi:MAG: DUF2182 domain-containing protein [Proteobacteria bacterium]|nr:DUF2182 domain-containing protein [Pseudomonadota bacterium]